MRLRVYARHRIPEVWLLDANTGEMTLHDEPAGDIYRLIRKRTAVDVVSPISVPGVGTTLTEALA